MIELAPHDETAFLSRQQLFTAWSAFCKRTAEHVGTRKRFVAALNRRKGFRPHKQVGTRGYPEFASGGLRTVMKTALGARHMPT
jgi:hypothetical protein